MKKTEIASRTPFEAEIQKKKGTIAFIILAILFSTTATSFFFGYKKGKSVSKKKKVLSQKECPKAKNECEKLLEFLDSLDDPSPMPEITWQNSKTGNLTIKCKEKCTLISIGDDGSADIAIGHRHYNCLIPFLKKGQKKKEKCI